MNQLLLVVAAFACVALAACGRIDDPVLRVTCGPDTALVSVQGGAVVREITVDAPTGRWTIQPNDTATIQCGSQR